MLTGNEIKKIVLNKLGITIKYIALPLSDKDEEFQCFSEEQDPTIPESPAQKFFEKNIEHNRVRLTVGPLLKSLSKSHRGKSAQFENHDIHDLRKQHYIISPSETVLVFTNEYVEFDLQYAGFILQRVYHYFKGLSIAPSYIAAGWKGILLVQITNNSKNYYKIKLGEDIARLFIFKTEGALDKNLEIDSRHLKKKWSLILQDKEDPFPQVAKAKSKFEEFKNFLNSWSLLEKILLIIILFFFLLVPAIPKIIKVINIIFNADIKYNTTIFGIQVTALVALLGLFSSILLRKR